MKEIISIVLTCSKAREDYKKTLIDNIKTRLKDLSIEQLIDIEHFMDDNLMI